MRPIPVLLVFLACSLAGCQTSTNALRGKPGVVDSKTGNLVAFWLEYDHYEDKPILVTEPYAVFMVWYNNEKFFSIYDNVRKTFLRTTDFDVFLQQLDALPHGIAIQRFDTCTVSRVHDMPSEDWQKVLGVLERGNRSWAISKVNGLNHEVICYCESKGFRYP